MTYQNQPIRRPGGPGTRKQLVEDVKTFELVRNFKGLPKGCPNYLDLRAVVEACSGFLGFTKTTRAVYCHLFSLTRKIDWEEGSDVIVWPSNEDLTFKLDITEKTLKAAFMQLRLAHLIAFKDSPTKMRYGGRDKKTQLIDQSRTFGIVLNPIAGLYDKFKKIAENLIIEARYRKQITRNVTMVRREAESALLLAYDVLPEADYTHHYGLISGLIGDLADTGSDYNAKERLIASCRGATEALHDIVTKDAQNVLDGLMAAQAAITEPMKDYLTKERSAVGKNDPPIRTITTASAGIGNRLSDKSSRGQGWDNLRLRPPAQAGEKAGALDRVSVYEPKKLSFDQVTACLPFDLRSEIRPDHGWYQLSDLLAERCEEYSVRVNTFREALSSMGRETACASMVVIIEKVETLNKPDNYLGSLMFKHRTGALHIERSLFGILERRKAKKPKQSQLSLEDLS